jgi:replicative DNA helicase
MADDVEQQMPHDLLAERSVLGAMLLSEDAITAVAEALAPEDFYSPRHALIFKTVLGMYERGEKPDMVTVSAALVDAGTDLVRQTGGTPYLHSLVADVPSAANVTHYARTVAERAVQRRLIEVGARIAQLGHQPLGIGRTVADLADLAQHAVAEVVPHRGPGDVSTLGELLGPTLDDIESAASRSEMVGVPTGFTDLDRLLNGLQPGQLIVIAARPSLGKTTLGVDICRAAAIRHQIPAAFFSLEMSKVELVTRILAAEARVPLHLLRSGHLSDDDWARLAKKVGDVAEAPLLLDDSPNVTLSQIRSKALRLRRQYGLRLLVIDYLQLMGGGSRSESRQQEVAALSRGLKLLAKELQIPVVAMSQLNRGPEGRTNKRPQLSDLRESGAIEQDADVVILLHRDDAYDKEHQRAGEADFILAKNRNGPTDTVTVAAQLHLSRFVDMAIPERVGR